MELYYIERSFKPNKPLYWPQALINEKATPEILSYRDDLVDDVIEQIKSQEENVQAAGTANVANLFIAQLYMKEIERLRYLVSSYLRTRLWKIEEHALYILQNETLRNRLSDKEFEVAQKYAEIERKALDDAFISLLPNDPLQRDEMVTAVPPELNRPVFCKVLEDVDVPLEDGAPLELSKNDIVLTRYSYIRDVANEDNSPIQFI
ncbi:hypothetical protein SARC_02728 [Sphaeroforma arctica JP610]|uniref:DNA replication complex GINS protein SLD5 n=1 Tax=Sphaeroforma arctica JP610 TaxID=667725 RepID=A0A0L0G7T2_9EUKA|nr:hypothetical protein SARC_02728 [Sphaeroforma arctica JP610]KNC85067.1 hypothetical protein SARC_02728 [Sphaeroforma arctica JP610]|eukprot:XP_014158969.1 hypothetical protein SARC_02728 [Sphaeroforma arctica JP610]